MSGGVFGTRKNGGKCYRGHDLNDPENVWIRKRVTQSGRISVQRNCKSCDWYRQHPGEFRETPQLYYTSPEKSSTEAADALWKAGHKEAYFFLRNHGFISYDKRPDLLPFRDVLPPAPRRPHGLGYPARPPSRPAERFSSSTR